MNFKSILIQPFLPEDRVDRAFLTEKLQEIFSLPVLWERPVPLPPEGFDPVRKQYLASFFLTYLLPLQQGDNIVLGIVSQDLYEPGLNFVFGVASPKTRTAVISTYRLHNSFYGLPEDENLFQERVLKEAVHEIGHTLGLGHCPNPECVMHFSNSILDTDRKSYLFCPSCYEKVKKAIGL
ncbi:MAG: archaemetzincin family Zn-dependent metalloprotease [Aquificae bacterium]|nr:archaemetzincin family Zn-dependent metalloprotease [Aquificota bacterium]